MVTNHVITCFLEHDNKILLLKRSSQVGSYQRKWAGISGYLPEGRSALSQAYLEIEEEASLNSEDLVLIKSGTVLEVPDSSADSLWLVHPFRFFVKSPRRIIVDWEHVEYQWIEPPDIKKFDCVPMLYDTWLKVADAQP